MENYRGLLEQYVERYNKVEEGDAFADGWVFLVDNLYYDTVAVAAPLGLLPQTAPSPV